MRLISINLAVFILIIMVVELVMRIAGFPVGYLPNTFDPPDDPIFYSHYEVDSVGLHSMLGREIWFKSEPWRFNEQGYVSPYEFSPEETESDTMDHSRVLLVGDSYTMGMDAWPLDSSFARILDQKPDLKIYNTGIPGMDLVQYRLVLEKYLQIIQPDEVLLAVCLQNDIAIYERTPRPGIPLWVQVKGFSSLVTEIYEDGQV